MSTILLTVVALVVAAGVIAAFKKVPPWWRAVRARARRSWKTATAAPAVRATRWHTEGMVTASPHALDVMRRAQTRGQSFADFRSGRVPRPEPPSRRQAARTFVRLFLRG